MAARSSRLLSSLRRSNGGAKATSTALPSLQRSLFSGSPTPGVSYWLPRSRSKWRILPTSPNRPPPPFEFVKRRIVALGRCFGKKSLSSSVFGLAFVSAMINRQASTLHAFDDFIDDEVELAAPSGQPKDKLHPFYTIVRKFQLPAVLVMTVLLGWRHPLTLFINVALLLFSSRPNPLSIYMFLEQLHQRDNQNTIWPRSKYGYKNIKVEDYKILCYATVELRDTKLSMLGILGGWWVVHASRS
ncbi:uncharacterized protein LOC122041364 isoform X1 [Zingiber officinale]|uniref:uncharacterized protein LOC122041364 isoform X1 n=1 Tax=Zingiber officinale TaxID=94328 RepID=UPI001C4B481E|nr:uncharacterized protein LOC122041364 isoform X1 [Zingiber officinale]